MSNVITGGLVRSREDSVRETGVTTEEAGGRQSQKPRNAGRLQKTEKKKKVFTPGISRRVSALLTS